ncbi:Uncharacterized protein Rs2_09093 [Raphanus sativus]|nr:Uncharacterized protein Rs2_09093 [Raphanus sativus]
MSQVPPPPPSEQQYPSTIPLSSILPTTLMNPHQTRSSSSTSRASSSFVVGQSQFVSLASDHGVKAHGDGWLLTAALIEGVDLGSAEDGFGFLEKEYSSRQENSSK